MRVSHFFILAAVLVALLSFGFYQALHHLISEPNFEAIPVSQGHALPALDGGSR